MTPKNLEELAFASYWNSRYAEEGSEKSFDWFKDFQSLKPFFQKHLLDKEARIVQLGCGNSTLSKDLYNEDYKNQLNVDFSEIIIEQMKAKHPEMEWVVMDVREMGCEDGSVDVAIDKGTLDAMLSGSLWDPPEEVRKNTKAYIDEVARILKPGGLFLYITYRQPHFIRPIITREEVWPGFVVESLQNEGGMLEYFGFVMRKQ
ncbi:hypothetical protein RUND412_008759 [Rhizina undulata]